MKDFYIPDMPESMDFGWGMYRVKRVEHRVWLTSKVLLDIGTKVILDLGFMKREDRERFESLVAESGHKYSLHYVKANSETRKSRVLERNNGKGEKFSLKVTPEIFYFMKSIFEPITNKSSLSYIFRIGLAGAERLAKHSSIEDSLPVKATLH